MPVIHSVRPYFPQREKDMMMMMINSFSDSSKAGN